MAITFREAVAEVELGLVSGDLLTDIATAGLLEGYESPALATLAGQFGEPYDPVQAERLWTAALDELHIPFEGTTAAAKLLVRAYARLVADGEVPPQLGASKMAGCKPQPFGSRKQQIETPGQNRVEAGHIRLLSEVACLPHQGSRKSLAEPKFRRGFPVHDGKRG